MWWANSKVFVTRQYFIEWIHEVFPPSAKKYNLLARKQFATDIHHNLPLEMDNESAHHPELADELNEELDFITLKLLSLNTTLLIQLVDQHII